MYCIAGLSTIGSISFGIDFEAGKTLVPSPAAGIIAFLIFIAITPIVYINFMNTLIIAVTANIASTPSAAIPPEVPPIAERPIL